MSSVDLTGGNVMDVAAGLLNDFSKQIYTYIAQSTYLRLALQELREIFVLHSVSVVEQTSAIIQVNAGVSAITFNAAGTPTNPKLPNDLVEPKDLWESPRGLASYTPMHRRTSLSPNATPTSSFIYYTWAAGQISFPAANQNNDIKIDYVRQLFPDAGAAIDQNTIINVINCQTFLEYRTAALCAEFIERNNTSASSLNQYAVLALERATGISVKGKQSIVTRRRPFRAGYKSRH